MPRVHWMDVPRASTHRMLVGKVPLGPGEAQITTPALRSALNLSARTCSRLGLEGRYGIEASRVSGLEVRLIFERADDAHKFATVADLPHPFERKHTTFTFDPAVCSRLEKIAGKERQALASDNRERADAAGLSWAQRPFKPKVQRRGWNG